MPRPPLSVDWQAIRGLYLQGVEPLTLANKFAIKISTLNSRIYREKWHEILQGEKKTNEKAREESVAIARDIWTERRETIRERIHLIGDRMTLAASQLSEDQLINKADKIKIATEIAGKSVGLDREEDRNQVNIAILGAIGSKSGAYDDIVQGEVWSESGRNLPANSVEHTESESVNTTTQPTTVPLDPAAPLYDNINNGF
jgi:hypothetical protein